MSQLTSAIESARPGDLVVLADGIYTGRWTLTRSGAKDAPIVLCGTRNAILQDTRYDGGAVVTLSGVDHVVLHGFTARTALWGIRLINGSNQNRISGLLIHDIGQEAVAVYGFSTHNVIRGNEIRETGRTLAAGTNTPLDHGSWVWRGDNVQWGNNNEFRNNGIDMAGASGYGIYGHSGTGPASTIVRCNNVVTNAGSGLSNLECR